MFGRRRLWLSGLLSMFLAACGSSELTEPTTDPTLGSSSPTVSTVELRENKITVTGQNLDSVNRVQILDKPEMGALAFYSITPQTLIIAQQSATQLVLTAATTLELSVGKLYNLILTTAQASETTITLAYTIEDGSLSLAKLATKDANGNTIASGQVLTFDGEKWAPALSTSSVTLTAGAVETDHLANSAITASKISAGAVTSTKLASGAVTTTAIAAGAVTAAKLATGAAPLVYINILTYMNPGNTTQYSSLGNATNQQTSTAARARQLVPRAGVFKNLKVLFNAGTITNNATATYTLMVNDFAQSISVQLTSDDDTAGTIKSDTTTEVSVKTNDTVYLREILAGGADFSTDDVYVTLSVELH